MEATEATRTNERFECMRGTGEIVGDVESPVLPPVDEWTPDDATFDPKLQDS